MSAKTFEIQKEKNIDLLSIAFRSFNQATQTLRESYQVLQQKISDLNNELNNTNKKLSKKVSELNEVRSYLNNILDSIMDGLLAVDLEGRITIFNKSAERITGYRAKNILGKLYQGIFERENKEFISILNKTFQEKKPLMGERPFFNGEKNIILNIITNPVVTPDNKIEGVLVVFRDISLLRYLKDEISRKERLAALGEMAARVAHEIRNPLSGIEGFALLLKDTFEKNDERKKWVESIVEGTRGLNKLVSDLLNFSRPLRVNFKPVDITEIIQSVIPFVKQKIEKEKLNIEIKKNFSEKIIALIDPEYMRQAFLNLMLNSVEAMPEGGELIISIEKKKYYRSDTHQFLRENGEDYIFATSSNQICIKFQDTGCGISEENLNKIFNPFYTTKHRGCGLGLAIVQQIIRAHGGKIEVKSKVEEGSCFTISIPLMSELKEIRNGCGKYSHSR